MLNRYPNKMLGQVVQCPDCRGTGIQVVTQFGEVCNEITTETRKCPRCKGKKVIQIEHKDVNDDPVQAGN